jgi:hypothetical protein
LLIRNASPALVLEEEDDDDGTSVGEEVEVGEAASWAYGGGKAAACAIATLMMTLSARLMDIVRKALELSTCNLAAKIYIDIVRVYVPEARFPSNQYLGGARTLGRLSEGFTKFDCNTLTTP